MDKPASESLRAAVATLVSEVGAREAASRLQLGMGSLVRLAGGFPVKKCTATLAAMHLVPTTSTTKGK